MKRLFGIVCWIAGCILLAVGLGEGIVTYWAQSCPKAAGGSQHRFLLSLSSFKRPILLSGQVLRLMNQDYPHFDLVVSVKGFKAQTAQETLLREWAPFMKSGRLKVRFDENKTQFSNLLDGVRDVDLTRYDYVCKIDDDDWYAPDYLTSVNAFLMKTGPVAMTSSRNAWLLYRKKGKTLMQRNFSSLSGPSMCFSIPVIQAALAIEADPRAAEQWFEKNYVQAFLERREDNILHQLGRKMGPAPERNKGKPKMIFGQQFPSVMREQYGR